MEPLKDGKCKISYFRVVLWKLKIGVSEGSRTGKFEFEMGGGEIVSKLELELGDPQKSIFFTDWETKTRSW